MKISSMVPKDFVLKEEHGKSYIFHTKFYRDKHGNKLSICFDKRNNFVQFRKFFNKNSGFETCIYVVRSTGDIMLRFEAAPYARTSQIILIGKFE